jgi:hypothetical protein
VLGLSFLWISSSSVDVYIAAVCCVRKILHCEMISEIYTFTTARMNESVNRVQTESEAKEILLTVMLRVETKLRIHAGIFPELPVPTVEIIAKVMRIHELTVLSVVFVMLSSERISIFGIANFSDTLLKFSWLQVAGRTKAAMERILVMRHRET